MSTLDEIKKLNMSSYFRAMMIYRTHKETVTRAAAALNFVGRDSSSDIKNSWTLFFVRNKSRRSPNDGYMFHSKVNGNRSMLNPLIFKGGKIRFFHGVSVNIQL